MTPAARIAAAIPLLDQILAGAPAEKVLTGWGRANRFAGSGDRAALRDLVYLSLRRRRSLAALGGADTGRGLMLGALREAGEDPAVMFTGQGHAPPPLGPADTGRAPNAAEALDLPDWLIPAFRQSLGDEAEAVARSLRDRAPVFLRVNLLKATPESAIAALARDGITASPHPLAATALEVGQGTRKIQQSAAYLDGLVELQDAASQAVVQALPLQPGMSVLDYCAGGGGKTLALAARLRGPVSAHDANPGRMRDLPERAGRAGARVRLVEKPARHAPFDLVLADAPCSGSGSWRRDPQGKWLLTPARLAETLAVQAAILTEIAPLVVPGGYLAYATCSLLQAENDDQIQGFLARSSDFSLTGQHHFTPLSGGDGFYLAVLRRAG